MCGYHARLDALRAGIKSVFMELASCLQVAEISDNPFLKSKSQEVQLKHGYLLGVFRACKAPQEISDRLADGIIADWAKAPALFYAPEMMDSCNPEILLDVEDILKKAEAELAKFHDQTMDCVTPESFQIYQAFAPGEEVVMARLLSAADVLDKSLDMVKSGINPLSSAPLNPFG